MHISEGVLSAPVLVTGAVFSIIGIAIGIKRLDADRVPLIALLSSTFFVASLIHVPIGPSSVHLILNGLCGIILGWAAFPAIVVALFIQAIIFQFGGVTTLGVNTFIMSFPAVASYYMFNSLIKKERVWIWTGAAFLSGALSVLGSGVLVAFALVFTGEQFLQAARLIILAHIPVMIIEGLVTAFSISFLRRVKPEILRGGSTNA